MVETHLRSKFGVVKSCKALALATSTYYYKPVLKKDESEIIAAIENRIEQHGPIGYIAMSKLLKSTFGVGKKCTYRIMKENGLLCKKVRKYSIKTTDSNHALPKYQNLLKSAALTDTGQALVGDVTQFSIRGRSAYLAMLSDLFNREIVGFAVSWSNDTSLVSACLKRALHLRDSLHQCIHHTDADTRYCSLAYTKILKDAGMKISMVCNNVYENAHAESLNKTLKYKQINLNEYDSLQEAEDQIGQYIKFYNTEKPHSALKWLAPVKYAERFAITDLNKKRIPVSGG